LQGKKLIGARGNILYEAIKYKEKILIIAMYMDLVSAIISYKILFKKIYNLEASKLIKMLSFPTQSSSMTTYFHYIILYMLLRNYLKMFTFGSYIYIIKPRSSQLLY